MQDDFIISVRDAALADVPSIATFLMPFVNEELLLPRTTEELQSLVRHGFVAERDAEIVGFAAIEIYSRKMAELQCLAVCSECRGRGIGKQLINLCVARAREENVLELMAITSSEKPFNDCGFHYALPNQKRALFLQTRDLA
jgi:amino-acid N-acetyltransferase